VLRNRLYGLAVDGEMVEEQLSERLGDLAVSSTARGRDSEEAETAIAEIPVGADGDIKRVLDFGRDDDECDSGPGCFLEETTKVPVVTTTPPVESRNTELADGSADFSSNIATPRSARKPRPPPIEISPYRGSEDVITVNHVQYYRCPLFVYYLLCTTIILLQGIDGSWDAV